MECVSEILTGNETINSNIIRLTPNIIDCGTLDTQKQNAKFQSQVLLINE